MLSPISKDAPSSGTRLYCFTVIAQSTGGTEPEDELDILRYAYTKSIGIFACEQAEVFSDVAIKLGPGFPNVVVSNADDDRPPATMAAPGSLINTVMFLNVWKAIARGAKYKEADWVAKVDTDTVFLPRRLHRWLGKRLVLDDGVYFETCRFVDYGYFGSLEVFSVVAFHAFLENVDMCKASLNWRAGIKNGLYGPMREDLFAQICLDKVGVRRLDAFDITTDGTCPADRPQDQKKNPEWKPNCAEVSAPAMHPFKKSHEWVDCHWATISKFGH